MGFSSPPETLSLPRILCLHGGGVSGEIFYYQSRAIIAGLNSHFRLVFVDGPFFSDMHPDLKPVYGGMGPTYRWSPWLKEQNTTDNETTIDEIEDCLLRGIREDEGTGAWVGLLGFSQGGNITASILLETQLRHASNEPFKGFAGQDWKFGIILAGSAPPKSLGAKETVNNKHFCPAGQVPDYSMSISDNSVKLRLPTLHVHGMNDPGLEMHQDLLQYYCETGSAVLVEWDEGHRVPFKQADVRPVVDGILKVAKAAGVQI